jgi:hypothetical protein
LSATTSVSLTSSTYTSLATGYATSTGYAVDYVDNACATPASNGYLARRQLNNYNGLNYDNYNGVSCDAFNYDDNVAVSCALSDSPAFDIN